MEFLHQLLVFLHFLGLAALIGGFLVGLRERKVTTGVFHGGLTQLVTGVLLVGVNEMLPDGDVDNVKIGVKLAVLLVILGIAWFGRKKIATGAYMAIGALAVINVGIAVFWT